MADLPPRPNFEPRPSERPRQLGPPDDRLPSSSYVPRDRYEPRREPRRDYDPRDSRDYDRDRRAGWVRGSERDRDFDRYQPRSRSRGRYDPEFDRRPPPSYDRDYDRGRDRGRPEYDRRPPSPRPPYDRDRDRDRSYPPPRYDRPPTERGYDRDRYPRDTSPPNWRRSSPPRGYRRDSRSPPRLSRRRSRSPPPSLYRRPSRSPPPKRLRLGNHSIGSPHSSRSSPHRRYRSPSPRRDGRRRSPSLDRQSRRHSPPPPPPRPSSRSSRHSQLEQGEHRSDSRPPEIKGPGVAKEQERDNQERHRSRSRSPRREQQVPPPAPKPQTTTSLSVNAGSGQTEPSQSASPLSSINSHSTPPQDMPKRASPAVPALPMISTDPWASPHPKDLSRPSTPAEQATHLPPRQPRNYRGRGDFRGGLRGTFRGLEPPRGPRNRGPSAVGATTPMSGSHPSPSPVSAPGLPGKDSLPSTPSQPVLVPTTLTGEVYVDSWESLVQQHIPQLVDLEHSYKNSMRQLDMMNKEYASIQKDYKSIYRVARRALHEFDMSAIDLRAAEARRRVTSQQHELARLGRLGVDAGTASLDVY